MKCVYEFYSLHLFEYFPIKNSSYIHKLSHYICKAQFSNWTKRIQYILVTGSLYLLF